MMDLIQQIFSFMVELLRDTDGTLHNFVSQYGTWMYAFLFLIIFCETGLVVTPFLPGDSLLFIAGTIAINPENSLQIHWLILLLIVAAILGDAANYTIGRFFGKKLFSNPESKVFKQEYLHKTNLFYEKHGGKTIILARFVPIVRTFAPFVAGMSRMTYRHFFAFNVIGGVVWVSLFISLGALLGTIPWVAHNIEKVALIIIFISLLPAIFEVLKAKLQAKKQKSLENPE